MCGCGKPIRRAAPRIAVLLLPRLPGAPGHAERSDSRDAELARLEIERDAIEERLVGLQRPATEAGMAAPITRLAASAPTLIAPGGGCAHMKSLSLRPWACAAASLFSRTDISKPYRSNSTSERRLSP